MFSKWVVAFIAACAMVLVGGTSLANDSGFGLGVSIGEPTGVSLKIWTKTTTAIQGGLAWSLSGDNDLHLQGDFVRHHFGLIKVSKGRLPLYYGLGARLRSRENRDDDVGIRVPVGLVYLFADVSFDIFVEVVPILDLVPDTDFDLNAALGARYFF